MSALAQFNFAQEPEVRRIQQALKHYYNSHMAEAAKAPLADIHDFGLFLYHDAHGETELKVAYLPTGDYTLVSCPPDVTGFDASEWFLTQVDRWLSEYTPDLVQLFESHAEQVSAKEHAWYRVNSVSAENALVLQKQLEDSNFWLTTMSMRTEMLPRYQYPMMLHDEQGLHQDESIVTREELRYRLKFFVADNPDAFKHQGLMQQVTSIFLDDDFYFFNASVLERDDHRVLQYRGRQRLAADDLAPHFFELRLELIVEKADPHAVLSTLARVRDVVGDRLEVKDGSMISEENRFGSLKTRAGLTE
jgi:hypothetical protein